MTVCMSDGGLRVPVRRVRAGRGTGWVMWVADPDGLTSMDDRSLGVPPLELDRQGARPSGSSAIRELGHQGAPTSGDGLSST